MESSKNLHTVNKPSSRAKKAVGIFFIACSFFSTLSGQKNQSYYVLGDTSYIAGNQVLPDNKANYTYKVQVKNGNKTISFNPNEVSEFKSPAGHIYFSLQIEGSDKRLFYERVVDGDLKLYYLNASENKGLYLETQNGDFIDISNSSNLREDLKNILNECPNLDYYISKAVPKKSFMIQLISRYNNGCSDDINPKISIGAGISWLKFTDKVEVSFVSLNEDNATTVAHFFINIPINRSPISFNAEVSTWRTIFHERFISLNFQQSYRSEIRSFNLPLTIKYSSLKKDGGFFAHLGPVIRINIEKSQNLRDSGINGELALADFPKTGLGGLIGVGYTYRINKYHAIGLEVRYQTTSGKSENLSEGLTDVTFSSNGYAFNLHYQF